MLPQRNGFLRLLPLLLNVPHEFQRRYIGLILFKDTFQPNHCLLRLVGAEQAVADVIRGRDVIWFNTVSGQKVGQRRFGLLLACQG